VADDWRRIIWALADPVRRQVYASAVLNVPVDLPPKKYEKASAALVSAGLLTPEHEVASEIFTALLDASPVITRTGIDRFVRDGRIERYPVRAADRLALLTWARDRALPNSSALTEQAFGERLALLTDDVASLRRYLVDAGLVVRDAAGPSYRRAE
jgi:hypothetical protein